MKQRLMKLTACFLAAGMTFAGTGTIVFADNENTAVEADAEAGQEAADTVDEADGEKAEETEAVESEEVKENPEEAPAFEASEDLTGQLTFAQCEEYINVRSGASTDSEVVAKIYNNDSATIIGQEGDWFKIQSGNAVGYVKAEYFATGEAAEAIAQEVAYNVAVVHPDELNIRSSADTESEPVGVAHSSEELEVVDYQGDWMKVALGGDVYGYVNAYYVDYKTYYPTAETLEEEQARLEAEQYQAEAPVYDDWSADAQAEADAAYQAQAEAEYQAYLEAQAAEAAQAEADAAYQQYLDAQAAADNSQAEAEAAAAQAQAEAEYQAYLEAQAAAEAQAQAEAEAAAKAQAEAEAAAAAQAAAEAAAAAQEQPSTEASPSEPEYTETSSSSTGQDIANYALQFVGNPYVWGGTSLTNGADCSGFVQSVFANFGIGLPRVAADQAGSGTSVDLSSIQAGDLLFYSGSGSGIDHVAIYIGGGSIVHASNPTSGITTSGAYYSTPVAAVRCW